MVGVPLVLAAELLAEEPTLLLGKEALRVVLPFIFVVFGCQPPLIVSNEGLIQFLSWQFLRLRRRLHVDLG